MTHRDDPYDIVVVGAGPAGSSAALAAARERRSVLLLERKDRVGVPVRCGEAVGLKGMHVTREPKGEWIKARITRVKLFSPAGIPVVLEDIAPSYVLDRERMDADCAQEAVAAGTELRCGESVERITREHSLYRVSTSCGSYRARIVICADGVESRCARDAGWKTALALEDLSSCAFCRVWADRDTAAQTVELHYGSGIANGGYAWVFPRGDDVVNVGLGVLGSRSTAGAAKAALERFVENRFGDCRTSPVHAGGVPVGRWLNPLVREGVMVVGDAARQVNALNGGGIAYAFFAGECAGTVAASSIKPDGTVDYRRLKRYHTIWARRFGKQQLRSFAIKKMVLTLSDRRMDAIARKLSSRKPSKMDYFSVCLRAFYNHPVLLLKALALFR